MQSGAAAAAAAAPARDAGPRAAWRTSDEGEAFPSARAAVGAPTLEDLTIDETLNDVQRIAKYGGEEARGGARRAAGRAQARSAPPAALRAPSD